MKKSSRLGSKIAARVAWGDASLHKTNINMAEANTEIWAEKDGNKVNINERNKPEIIKLKEKDVPGAILPSNAPEECTVKQLQRWLLCRGAKTTGKKMQLVQR